MKKGGYCATCLGMLLKRECASYQLKKLSPSKTSVSDTGSLTLNLKHMSTCYDQPILLRLFYELRICDDHSPYCKHGEDDMHFLFGDQLRPLNCNLACERRVGIFAGKIRLTDRNPYV